jgi:hypothetical protein
MYILCVCVCSHSTCKARLMVSQTNSYDVMVLWSIAFDLPVPLAAAGVRATEVLRSIHTLLTLIARRMRSIIVTVMVLQTNCYGVIE